MSKIDKDELFKNLTDFLKVKGIEVKDGSYPEAIRQGCSILADTINLTQKALGCAKAQVDKTLDQMRRTAPDLKTGPQPPPGQAPPSPPAGEPAPPADAAAAAAPEPEETARSGAAPPPPDAAKARKPETKPRRKPAPRKTRKRPARAK